MKNPKRKAGKPVAEWSDCTLLSELSNSIVCGKFLKTKAESLNEHTKECLKLLIERGFNVTLY